MSEGEESERVQQIVELKEDRKEIYTSGEKTIITALGCTSLNKIAGLSIIDPKSLGFSGTEESTNPFVHFSDKGKRIISFVAVRKRVQGNGPTGFASIDMTILFSTHTYLMDDLQNKVKIFEGVGGYGTETQKPAHVEGSATQLNKNSLVPFEVTEGVFLWVDYSHLEIQSCLREHTRRVKFAERIATGIAIRNCMKSHPSIGVSIVENLGGYARVPVFGYKQEKSWEELKEINKKLDKGEPVEGVTVVKEQIEATLEDTELATEDDEHGIQVPAETNSHHSPPTGNSMDMAKEQLSLRMDIEALKQGMDQRLFYKVITEERITDLTKISIEQAKNLILKLRKQQPNLKGV